MFVQSIKAQNTRIRNDNSILWTTNTTSLKFDKKWSGHFEYQWRRAELGKNWQQSLLRFGVNYKLNDKVTARVGYTYIETFNYGDIPLQAAGKPFGENRTYEMILLNDNIKSLDISHRFMLEQRWVNRYSKVTLDKTDETIFQNRLRYMLRTQLPITRKKLDDKTLYTALYDEVFVGLGKNVNENVFDQNRLGILIGYKFNKKFRVEAGYLQQILQLGREIGGANVFQYNNGIILNTLINLDLSKK